MTRKAKQTPERESNSGGSAVAFSPSHSPPIAEESCLRCGPPSSPSAPAAQVPHPIPQMLPKVSLQRTACHFTGSKGLTFRNGSGPES